jgi:tetratricopeptide (TPR) repeat protein/type IV secretory pathway TrbD component
VLPSPLLVPDPAPPDRETFRSPKERRESRKQGQSRTRRGFLDRWLEGLLFSIVLGSVLAIGSVHVSSLLVVATASFATGVLALIVHRRDNGGWPVTLPAVGALLLALFTAAQAVPLPASLVSWLAPANADVWARALSPLGLPGPAWHPISLDPGATWVEVLKALTYTALIVASSVVAYRRGATFGVATVFFSALTLGGLTLAHGLADMTKVFGIYDPIHNFASWAIGPLLNANHLAGYLNLGALCGLGILLMRKTRIPRWVAGLGVATIMGVGISTVSRGGVILLPLGFAILVLLLRSRPESLREQAVSNRWLHVLTLVTAAGGVTLAALAFTTRHWDELLNEDLSKLKILDWAKPLVSDHPWFGVGRGAFETVYPAYRPNPGHQLWTHPENLFVQWAAEWGLPVAVAAVLFFAWLMRPSRMGATRSAVAAGAVAGILILVLQNWVDFSLEMPGVAVAAVVLIGSCWGDTRRRGVARWRGDSRLHRLLGKLSLGASGTDSRALGTYLPIAVFGLVGLGAVAMAGWKGSPTALQDRMAFQDIAKGPPMPKGKFDPLVREAMLRHPAEPYLPLVGAERAWRVRDDNPIPFLQRVFERSKVYGRAHLLLADILFARGAKGQALMELKFASRDEPGLATSAVAMAIEHTQQEDDLRRMVPEGPDGALVLDTLGAWMHKRNPAAGERFDKQALELDPSRLAPRGRRAQDLVDALSKEGLSDKEKHQLAEGIEQHAVHIDRAEPHTSRAAQLRARALVALGQPEKADRLLATACDHVTDRHACMRARVPILASLNRPKELDELLDATAKAGCTGGKSCAQTYMWLGATQRGRKNLGGAANAYLKATRHDPQNADAWVQLGDVSTALGTHAQAVRAYEQAVRLRPDDEGLKKKLEAARGKMMGGFLR